MATEKVHIKIMFIGHADSGKSTIASHLIYKLGGIDKSVVEGFEKEAPVINKDAWVLDKVKSEYERGITIDKSVIERIEKEAAYRSLNYAWVLEKLKSERERGITIDIDLSKFETTKYYCSVIVAHAHMDFFLKTMITRTSQPDCVVLVIDSTTSGFETSKDRQARALAHLSFVFGVKEIICCCNKIDATIPKYSKKRFSEIVLKLMPFLWMVGYHQYKTRFIPISGFDGDNLIERSTNFDWYKGQTLLEALDHFNEPIWPSIKGLDAVTRLKFNLPIVSENALAARANIESNCWELQPQNKMGMVSGPHLDEKLVRSIVDEIKQVITASSSRNRARAEEESELYESDDEEGVFLKEKNEQEVELFDNIGACLGTLIKTFRASFLPFFEEISSSLTPMFGKDKTSKERRIAICIFDDVAEHCREAAHKYYGSFLPFLLEACNDECSDVRQAAVYGVGVCAEFGGSVFKPLVAEALARLNAVITHPNAQHSNNVMACSNAVSALEKICQFHHDSINAAQVDEKVLIQLRRLRIW